MTEPKKISAPTLAEKAPVQRTRSPQEESWEQDTLAPVLEKIPSAKLNSPPFPAILSAGFIAKLICPIGKPQHN